MIKEVDLPERGDNEQTLRDVLDELRKRGSKSLDIIIKLGPLAQHSSGCTLLWDDSDSTACLVMYVEGVVGAIPLPIEFDKGGGKFPL